METKTEMKTLVCILTEGDKERYKAECSSLEGALWSLDQRSKRLGLVINGLKIDHDSLIYANRFGLVETDAIDQWGGFVLVPIDGQAQKSDLANKLLDVTCAIEETKEKRALVLGRKKAAEARIVELAKALKSGKEDREVECEWRHDAENNLMDLVRTDTWEVVSSRPLTDQERQLELDFQRKPRAMVQCPVCPIRVTITAGRLDSHKDLDKEECITTGLTTVDAENFGAKISEQPTRPGKTTLEALKREIVASAPKAKPLKLVDPVEEEDDAVNPEDESEVTSEWKESWLDAEAAIDSADSAIEDMKPSDPIVQEVVQQDDVHQDPADATKTILASLKLATVADIFPRHVEDIMEKAGRDAAEVRAYLLGMCADQLKATTKRSLSAWGQ